MKAAFLICSVALATALPVPAQAQDDTPVPVAQNEPIKRTPLQKLAVPDAGYETVVGLAELAPSTSAGRHTHPGLAVGYVIYGGLEILVDGEPIRTVRAGESFTVPANVVHEERSLDAGAKVIGVYVVPQGQPIATPAK